MNLKGQKHLIKCRCVLPQFKNSKEPVPHHFKVFSVIDENDQVIPKYCQCNNCGIIHKVVDICKSEIQVNKEHMNSLIKVEDIKSYLHPNFCNILESNNVDISTWEHVQFAVENKLWGEMIVLVNDTEDQEIHGKYIKILGESLCKVESFTRSSGAI